MTTKPTQTLLVCNAGSSSLKLACYELMQGQLQEAKSVSSISGSSEDLLKSLKAYLEKHFPQHNDEQAPVILHRIVHAGRQSEGALAIDEQLLKTILHWQVLAPLHNALALSIISVVSEYFSESKNYAVFDSGLYADLPALAKFYALPDQLSPEWPVERYGFHGIAHRCLWKSLPSQNKPKRVITVQLGSGCSATAWLNGKVMDTSMGFTPLEGLSMATRSGSIDPGILLHLLTQEAMNPEQVQSILNKQSGLVGLSYSSKDSVSVLNGDDAQSQLSVEHFCYQVAKMIGAYSVTLGGLDAICFGGGIAENNPHVLKKILSYLAFMGFDLDDKGKLQEHGVKALHQSGSKVQAWLVCIDEMREMVEQYCFKNSV